jgi:hypothetical protein
MGCSFASFLPFSWNNVRTGEHSLVAAALSFGDKAAETCALQAFPGIVKLQPRGHF